MLCRGQVETAPSRRLKDQTMKFLKIVSNGIDKLNTYSGLWISLLAVPMILALIYEVVARYGFNKPTIWSYEATYMIYGTHFLIGSAYTLKIKGHIKIEVLYSFLSVRARAVVDLLGYLLLFFPVIIIMIFAAWDMALDAYVSKEVSQYTPLKPILWPFKGVVFIGFFLLCLQGVSETCKAIIILITGKEVE